MTREEKLYSMKMQDLVKVADKLGIKINAKAAKSQAIEKILAAEAEKEIAEVMQQKKDLDIECPKIESYELVNEDTCADGTSYAEISKEIAVQAKEKAKLVPVPGTEDPDCGKKAAAETYPETTQKLIKKPKRGNLIEYNGKAQTLTQWAKELNKPVQTLYYRIKMKGWNVEKAFTK